VELLVSPVTVRGEAAPAALNAPQLNVYDVIADPPLETGAEKATMALPLPAAVAVIAGAPGMLAGVTLFEGADASPVPWALVAVTVNV
jgi:hypothetical protein